jgi:hypothetical protein
MTGCPNHEAAPAIDCDACDAVLRPPRFVATTLDVAELRNMIRNVQLSCARIEAALAKKERP